MKKTVLTFVWLSLSIGLFAQVAMADRMEIAPQFKYTKPAKKKIAPSVLKWDQQTHDFGQIDYQKPVTGVFELTNTSLEPIIIKDAKGSCGCTGTTFPKEAVLPGQTVMITATYDAKNIGTFNKTVTVLTSADDKDSKGTVLKITGEVIWRL